jgi:hypothetical protein
MTTNDITIYEPLQFWFSNNHELAIPLFATATNIDVLKSKSVLKLKHFAVTINTYECPICMDEINTDVLITNCGHHFCQKCMDVWLNKNNTCPICRNIIL